MHMAKAGPGAPAWKRVAVALDDRPLCASSRRRRSVEARGIPRPKLGGNPKRVPPHRLGGLAGRFGQALSGSWGHHHRLRFFLHLIDQLPDLCRLQRLQLPEKGSELGLPGCQALGQGNSLRLVQPRLGAEGGRSVGRRCSGHEGRRRQGQAGVPLGALLAEGIRFPSGGCATISNRRYAIREGRRRVGIGACQGGGLWHGERLTEGSHSRPAETRGGRGALACLDARNEGVVGAEKRPRGLSSSRAITRKILRVLNETK